MSDDDNPRDHPNLWRVKFYGEVDVIYVVAPMWDDMAWEGYGNVQSIEHISDCVIVLAAKVPPATLASRAGGGE